MLPRVRGPRSRCTMALRTFTTHGCLNHAARACASRYRYRCIMPLLLCVRCVHGALCPCRAAATCRRSKGPSSAASAVPASPARLHQVRWRASARGRPLPRFRVPCWRVGLCAVVCTPPVRCRSHPKRGSMHVLPAGPAQQQHPALPTAPPLVAPGPAYAARGAPVDAPAPGELPPAYDEGDCGAGQ